MSSESDTASTDSESVATTHPFCADDADVIIRAKGPLDFRVHKCNLSFVSPVFKDMFTIPQPSFNTLDVLPHANVQDPPGAWENILRTIYPMPNPTIDNIDDLESLLLTAKKYEMKYVIDSHIRCFENRAFIRDDPLRLYTIACAGGFEEQAKYVASHAEHSTVVGRSDIGDLESLTLDSYHRLVSFLLKRDKEWDQILAKAQIPGKFRCKCTSRSEVYGMIKRDLGAPHFSTDEIYLNSLKRSSEKCTTSIDKIELCGLETSKVRGFIDSMAAKKDQLCNKLMW